MNQYTSAMTFLYFDDFEEAIHFFEEILALKSVYDPGWARVYEVTKGAYLGAVDRSKGSLTTAYQGGTLVSLTVSDLNAYYDKIKNYSPASVTDIKHFEDLGLKSFFFKGPGAYDFEIQMFIDPSLKAIF